MVRLFANLNPNPDVVEFLWEVGQRGNIYAWVDQFRVALFFGGKPTRFNCDDHTLAEPTPNQKGGLTGLKGEQDYRSFRSR
jgi:hypothetical protein